MTKPENRTPDIKPITKQGLSRRSFLNGTASGLALSLAGCSEKVPDRQKLYSFLPGKPLPWINFGGNQICYPKNRIVAKNEEQIVEVMKNTPGVIRAVGSSHSWSALVPTDDTLVATDLLSGLVGHNTKKMQAEVYGGTRLHTLGPLLASVGMAQENMPDMAYPSIAGAIATSVHGTGENYGSLSTQVAGLTLATPSGELLQLSKEQNPEIFNAAKVNLGALGIVTRINLQCEPSFELTEISRAEETNQVLEDLDMRMSSNRLFEFLPIPHTGKCVTVTTNIAKPGDNNKGKEEDPNIVNELRAVYDKVSWIPGIGSKIYTRLIDMEFSADLKDTIRTGPSYIVLPHIRNIRLKEMEYMVPVEHGPSCLREILNAIESKGLTSFPLEYRHTKGDDIMMSMFEGRDSAVISIHEFGDLDHRPYYSVIEPIFAKYQGRPHWGKMHTLTHKELSALYPKYWQDFQNIRRELDPTGKMLNTHLKEILGV